MIELSHEQIAFHRALSRGEQLQRSSNCNEYR